MDFLQPSINSYYSLDVDYLEKNLSCYTVSKGNEVSKGLLELFKRNMDAGKGLHIT